MHILLSTFKSLHRLKKDLLESQAIAQFIWQMGGVRNILFVFPSGRCGKLIQPFRSPSILYKTAGAPSWHYGLEGSNSLSGIDCRL